MAASQNDTVVYSPPGVATAAITDARGNAWAINAAGQVTVNGVVDHTTGNVTELAYVNGKIWQENTAGLWWSKSKPTDAWGPTYGTSANPIQGVDLNLTPDFGPNGAFARPVSVGNLSATGGTHTLAIPVGTDLVTTGVRLTNSSLTISYGAEAGPVTINGNSTLNHATLETISTPPHPMGSGSIVNNGTMTLSASALTVGGVTGTGSIVATNGSTITLDRSYATSENIKLTSGHLYLVNSAELGSPPAIAFLAPITGFNSASAITLDDIQATSEVFAKTSPTVGDLTLFNGATEVASMQISGAAHVYASIVQGTTAFTDSILLTATDTGHSLPIAG